MRLKKYSEKIDPIQKNEATSSISSLFQITLDTDQEGTIDAIKKGVEFKGVPFWSLIFAIFIASIGLNTNSTAVIIGAMLISPLMGPIMGAGLGLGIYDFELLKKSFRNLLIMTIFSLLTSTFYFFISPLSGDQSELLARTYPTIYDVLIAFFGGATGIIAGSRKEKISNAIPGVAIATALMPPLCTAGFGLANGNFRFFAGALYLYLINSVFIGIATFIFVRYFKFKPVINVDKKTDKKIHQLIFILTISIITPSLFMAYDVISQETFERKINQFISANFTFEKTKILTKNIQKHFGKKIIEITTYGEPLSVDMISHLTKNLKQYDLEDVELKIVNSNERAIQPTKNSTKDELIKNLEEEIKNLKSKENLLKHVSKEVNILFPDLISISFGDLLIKNIQDISDAKEPTILVKWRPNVKISEKKRLELFLISRMGIHNMKILEVK